ncbi:MAG TPA: phosphoglucosamine mutase [Oscillospiraceae bacterium]|nr:phosphoglucosamine mutase [Oscillospiraceae bacterium]
MGRLFGTDGARGVAITELTCELAMNIGRAAACVLTKHTNHRPRILVGKDTRVSSDVLEAALCAGICSVGADVEILGVVPTPAVAYLVRKYGADAGVVISASHNTVEYNGIKLFNHEGFKLSDEIEEEIEALVLDNPQSMELKNGTEIGKVKYAKWATRDYINYIMRTIPDNLSGMRIAVDCANGSASTTAEDLFIGLGANVHLINNKPDGININENCGSTNIEVLSKFVKDNRCHAGVAFDGDADRCIAVDENGEVVDGDKMLGIFAKTMRQKGELHNNAVVVTVMSNMGFFKFCKENNIDTAITKVGDRYVLEEMRAKGYNLGGEQSGHIIFLDHATTGDGELSAVQLLSAMKLSELKMSELADDIERYPQIMINIKISEFARGNWQEDEGICSCISEVERELGDDARVLVRESGTEPLIRVMIEGKNFDTINEGAMKIAEVIRQRCPK